MNGQIKYSVYVIVFLSLCHLFLYQSIIDTGLSSHNNNKFLVLDDDTDDTDDTTTMDKDAAGNLDDTNNPDKNEEDDLKEVILLSSTNFSLSSDIDKIYHSPRKQEIHVHLSTESTNNHPASDSNSSSSASSKRRCKSPKLRARLSGPYLALVTWEHDSIFTDMNIDNYNHTSNDNDVNVIIGHYQVPKGGTYFIEIIAILCETPRYHDNFTSACLEDLNNNVISAYNATIKVLDSPAPEKNNNNKNGPGKPTFGFWKWKGDLSENVTQIVPITSTRTREYSQMKTRYQPTLCWKETNKTIRNILRCDEKEDRKRFLDYQFEWQNDTINDSLQIGAKRKRTRIGDLEQFKAKKENVCIFGVSHSHFIRKYSDDLSLTQSISFGGTITLIKYHIMPEPGVDLSKDYVDAKQRFNCTKGLVGFGQWPGSYDGGAPVLFWQYEQLMNRVVNTMREVGIEPIFRALHWIPIASRVGSCPPGDWRIHAMEGYNEILKKVGKELNVPYLDSEFIVAPMWDESADFNHVNDERAWREVNFIMRNLIKLQA